MKKREFDLTIVIPTKNRQLYAYYAVKQVLMNKSSKIQVVVQDNSDNCDLKFKLDEFSLDFRLKYCYISEVISTVENFNKSIENADGEYICVIGDDDGINHQIIEFIEIMREQHIDILKPAISLGFDWPSIDNKNNIIKSGTLSIKRVSGKKIKYNTFSGVIELLKNGGQGYLNLQIAKTYHGVVRKECMEIIKQKTGHYFGGLSPDIYSAISLSLNGFNTIEIDYPLTISGVCPSSASASSSKGRHVGKLAEAPHLVGNPNYKWEIEIPKFYSVETIWAETAIKSIKDNGKESMISKYFSKNRLYFYCYFNHPGYSDVIFDNEESESYVKKMKMEWLIFSLKNQVARIKGWVLRKLAIDKYEYGIPSIIEASYFIEKELQKKQFKSAYLLASHSDENK